MNLPDKNTPVLVVGEGPTDIAAAYLRDIYPNGNLLWQLVHTGGYACDGDFNFEPTGWVPLLGAHSTLERHLISIGDE